MVILEFQIKTMLKFHLIPERRAIINKVTRNNAGETVGTKEPSSTAGGSLDGTTTVKTIVKIPQKAKQTKTKQNKLGSKVSFDPTNPLLDIFLK